MEVGLVFVFEGLVFIVKNEVGGWLEIVCEGFEVVLVKKEIIVECGGEGVGE